MKNKNPILIIIGILFLLIGGIGIRNSLIYTNTASIFWFCYIALILMGIGSLTRNGVLITMQLNILAIPFIIWNADFFYYLFTSKPLFGITDYWFLAGPILPKLISLQHIITVPLSLYILYLLKPNIKNTWKYTILELSIIFILTILLTNPQENINCVFESCVSFITITKGYSLVWFTLTFIMACTTNYLLMKLPFLKTNEIKK